MATSKQPTLSVLIVSVLIVGYGLTVLGIGMEFGISWATTLAGSVLLALGMVSLFAHLTSMYLLRGADAVLTELQAAANKLPVGPSSKAVHEAIQQMKDRIDMPKS